MIDTTNPSYWLSWRFLLCAIYLLCTIAFASFLVWKYEGAKKPDNERREHQQQVPVGVLFKDEVWKTCLKGLHPVWLMFFRILVFVFLLGIITGNAIFHGFGVFFYYTQWTFTLTTIYFGVASVFSIYGYCQRLDHEGTCGINNAPENGDAEQGYRVDPAPGSRENTSLLKSLYNNNKQVDVRQIAGPMGYALQIVYQVTAGAVMLTDVVFWLVIYPFLTAKDFRLAFFDVWMHSVNILVLGDTMLNCMVSVGGFVAHSLLWNLCFNSQIEAPLAFKIISRVLSVFEVNYIALVYARQFHLTKKTMENGCFIVHMDLNSFFHFIFFSCQLNLGNLAKCISVNLIFFPVMILLYSEVEFQILTFLVVSEN